MSHSRARRLVRALTTAGLVGVVAAVGACSSITATESVPAPAPPVTPVAHPLLIKHGWDSPTPAFVKAHVTRMERLPFDGVTIKLPDLSNKVMGRQPVDVEDLKDALAPVAATRFSSLAHNFVILYAAPAGDMFEDWSVPLANAANLARAARDAGLDGIFFDVEQYFGATFEFPENCADHTISECRRQALLRGTQLMDAMRAAWPAIRVLSTYGPWVSDAATATHLQGVPYSDVSKANPLVGSFLIGMISSTVGTGAQVIDGGEIYTARTRAQFARVKDWQQNGMASSYLVPASLRDAWSRTISAGFGVYDQPWLRVGMDADIWRTTLAAALASTDQYVWAYTERYDWWGTGWPIERVPADWVAAAKAARVPG